MSLLLLLLVTMMTTTTRSTIITTATIRNDFPVACVRSRVLKAQVVDVLLKARSWQGCSLELTARLAAANSSIATLLMRLLSFVC